MNLDELRVVGLFQFAAPLDGENRTWIQVMITGKFKHAKHGPFEITAEDLDLFAADIQERADQIVIDFDHDSAYGSTKAAGWYTGQTEIKDDDLGRPALFAEIELTPAGAEAVRNKEYRFISPEFSRTYRDAAGQLVKKVRMWATALTNRPFLPDMAPVTLSDEPASLADVVWAPTEGYQQLQQKVHAALNAGLVEARYWVMDIADGKTLVDAYADGKTWVVPFTVKDGEIALAEEGEWTEAEKEWIESAKASHDALSQRPTPKPDPTPDPTVDPPKTEGDQDMTNEILTLLGLPEHADDATILAALQARDQKVGELEDLLKAARADAESAKTLSNRVAELEKDAREGAIRAILASEVEAGRVLPVEVDQLAESFAENVDGLKALLNTRPPAMFARALKEHGHGAGTDDDPDVRRVAAGIKGDDPVGEDGARLHVAAEAILAEQGKKAPDYTSEEYVAALQEAEKKLLYV